MYVLPRGRFQDEDDEENDFSQNPERQIGRFQDEDDEEDEEDDED